MADTVSWMSVIIECSACQKTRTVVLGTTLKEDHPIAQCPECNSPQIKILSITPKQASK